MPQAGAADPAGRGARQHRRGWRGDMMQGSIMACHSVTCGVVWCDVKLFVSFLTFCLFVVLNVFFYFA